MKFEKERKSSIWPRQKGFVCVFQILTELPASLCFSINKQTIAFHPHRTPKRNPPTSTSSKKKKMHTQIYTLDITMGLKGGTFAGIYMKHVWKFSVKSKNIFYALSFVASSSRSSSGFWFCLWFSTRKKINIRIIIKFTGEMHAVKFSFYCDTPFGHP